MRCIACTHVFPTADGDTEFTCTPKCTAALHEALQSLERLLMPAELGEAPEIPPASPGGLSSDPVMRRAVEVMNTLRPTPPGPADPTPEQIDLDTDVAMGLASIYDACPDPSCNECRRLGR